MTTTIDTDINAQHGQNRCPSCGATDISYDIEAAALQCGYCRTKLEPEPFSLVNAPIDDIEGVQIGAGAETIEADANAFVTLKCQSCGAEVVINSDEAVQARCHWCRQTLSLSEAVPNGAVPDMLLPFTVKRDEAMKSIRRFVRWRMLLAKPKFRKEFKAENLFGVYMPYMTVDVNAKASMSGRAEIKKDSHLRRVGKDENRTFKTFYDADMYKLSRSFKILINNLSLESSNEVVSKDKGKGKDKSKSKAKEVDTNNVVNAVMPFDVENSVRWNANYLRGFRSEKRNRNISDLKKTVNQQVKDIARFKANETITQYDRGARWTSDTASITGERWLSAYYPVWLYSYIEKTKDGDKRHFIAVNGRTKETMGSIPVNRKLIWFITLMLIFFFAWGGPLLDLIDASEDDLIVKLVFAMIVVAPIAGIVFGMCVPDMLENADKRHRHETETEAEISDIACTDEFLFRLNSRTELTIFGKNNDKVGKDCHDDKGDLDFYTRMENEWGKSPLDGLDEELGLLDNDDND